MKINPIDPRSGSRISPESRMAPNEAFSGEMSKANRDLINRDLQDLIKRIDDMGERLENGMTLSDLRDYKRLVGDFLRLVSRRGFTAEQETSWGCTGQQKMYTVVRTIDREMARMGEMLLKDEEDHLAVVSTMDQIRGIILDLYA